MSNPAITTPDGIREWIDQLSKEKAEEYGVTVAVPVFRDPDPVENDHDYVAVTMLPSEVANLKRAVEQHPRLSTFTLATTIVAENRGRDALDLVWYDNSNDTADTEADA